MKKRSSNGNGFHLFKTGDEVDLINPKSLSFLKRPFKVTGVLDKENREPDEHPQRVMVDVEPKINDGPKDRQSMAMTFGGEELKLYSPSK